MLFIVFYKLNIKYRFIGVSYILYIIGLSGRHLQRLLYLINITMLLFFSFFCNV